MVKNIRPRLVVGSGRAPGNPPRLPNDITLDVDAQQLPHIIGDIRTSPVVPCYFEVVLLERLPPKLFNDDRVIQNAAKALVRGGQLEIVTSTMHAPICAILQQLKRFRFKQIFTGGKKNGKFISAVLP